jgi:hypothetical protein
VGWPVKVAGQSGSVREYDGKIPFYLNFIRGLLSHFPSLPQARYGRWAARCRPAMVVLSICSRHARLFDRQYEWRAHRWQGPNRVMDPGRAERA